VSPIKILPAPDNHYPEQKFDHQALFNGQTLQVSATGGTVPAFQALLVTPSLPVITSPFIADYEQQMPLIVSHDKDLVLHWTNGGAGTLGVGVSWKEGSNTKSFNCAFNASAGSGTIPQAFMQMVGDSAELSFSATNTVTVPAAPFSIDLTAISYPVLPDGHYALANLSFQ
jgi:hypothetical protein